MPGLLDPKNITKQLGVLRRVRRTPISSVASTGVGQVHVDELSDKKPRAKKKRDLQRKYSAAPELTPEEVAQLQGDITQQLQLNKPEEAVQVVPDTSVQEKLRQVMKGNAEQTRGGLLGGLGLGAVAGGVGAVTTGLAKGLEKAPSGLAMAIPGAFKGYRLGKKLVQNKQVKGLLEDTYQAPSKPVEVPPDTLKMATVDPGFGEILRELTDEKKRGVLNRQGVKSALKDLQQGRRINFNKSHVPLTGDEKQMLHKALGSKLFKAQRQRPAVATGGAKSLLGRSPKAITVMGGLAALSALGLTAAQVQQYRKNRPKESTEPK